MKWDTVVVGAGIGGLSAASLFAKTGMKVEVFEKTGFVGGRARSKRLEDGSVHEKLRILPSADMGEIASLMNLLGAKIEVVPFEEILTYHQGKLISDKELIQDPEVKKEVDRIKIEILTMSEDEMRAVEDISFEE